MEMVLKRTNTNAKGLNLAEKECREGFNLTELVARSSHSRKRQKHQE
jgi:hypothetical protein